MSFDPITLAMAKPKVIDLCKYGIGQAMVGLFAQGGGETTLEDVGDFWEQMFASREKNVALSFAFYGLDVNVSGIARCFTSEVCTQVCCSFLFRDSGVVYDASATIQRSSLNARDAYIFVKATSL